VRSEKKNPRQAAERPDSCRSAAHIRTRTCVDRSRTCSIDGVFYDSRRLLMPYFARMLANDAVTRLSQENAPTSFEAGAL
jgi:hypothetical protein